MIADAYYDFLSNVLESARRWGPYNPAVVRRIELGTQRYLLEPARKLEAELMDDKTALEKERNQVREALRPVWDRGLFGYEITHWPSGPGSARAMELVYANSPLAYDVASHYTEAFLLSRDLAHAVRSRRDTLRDLITSELNAHEGGAVLDLACGPCQSLREALPLLKSPERIELRGLDTDELAQINNRGYFQRAHKLPWEFEVANVLKSDFGQNNYDLVYSTGLYDYIPSKALSELWRRVYASLKPGGLAILSVKDGANFCSLFYRWAINWSQFYIRVEPEFQRIMQDAELPAPESILRDATGCIIFYLVRKPR